jgi:hypothetical protein
MGVCRPLFAFLAAATLLGCGGESAAATLRGPLDYQRSGGLAGVTERLALQPSGRARLETRARRRSFTLPRAERRRVERAVAAAHLARVKVPGHGITPDAFVYSLTYRGRTLVFDDPSMPKAVRGLVTELRKLVAKHR